MAASGPTLPDPRTMDPRDFALALALHEQFTQLNTSVREYGASHNLHYSTVSCYLSCKKSLPPWSFIKTLAEDAARVQGFEKSSRAMIVYLWTLLKNAEKAREKDSVDKLRAELDKARVEVRAHAEQERRINDQLLAAKTHIANLKSDVLALESGHVRPLDLPSTELALRNVETQLRDERASAEQTIADLRAQLDREHELKEKAEQDCERYEELIRKMLAAAGNPVDEAGDLRAVHDEPLLELATAPVGGEAHSAPAYPAELTEWLRSRLDAKDAEIDAKNAELDAKETRIAELQDRITMLLHQYSRANRGYLEQRDKALSWERRCEELQKAGDHARWTPPDQGQVTDRRYG